MCLAEPFFYEALACAKLNCEHKSAPTFKDIENEIRNHIAQKIEELRCDSGTCTDDRRGIECLKKNALLDLAAMIARGESDDL